MRRVQYFFIQAGVEAISMAAGFYRSRLLFDDEPWYGWWDAWLASAYY